MNRQGRMLSIQAMLLASLCLALHGSVAVASESQRGLSKGLSMAAITEADLQVAITSADSTAFATTDYYADRSIQSCCDSDPTCGSPVCGSSCNAGCCDKRFLGLFKRSEPCFDRFISPMTNPVFFEDPRTLTEARAIFLQHRVPNATAGGNVQLFALQLRAALTDRLSIVASKDGFITSSNPIIDDGWADLAMGLKYNLLADPVSQRLLSAGFHYELPVGSPSAVQGNGDGEFHLYLTGGTQLGRYWHWLSGSGFRLPSDPGAESSMWYWSNHFDLEVTQGWYALTEFNWYSWMGSGQNAAFAGVEGGDLFNLGSTGVAGNNIVTNAVGLKYKHSRHNELGIAFEYPLTERKDILENRLTVDWIFRY